MPDSINTLESNIDDQINGILVQIQESEAEIDRLQELIPNLQHDIEVLRGMKENLSNLSSNTLTINVNVNGSSSGQMSVPVNHGVNI